MRLAFLALLFTTLSIAGPQTTQTIAGTGVPGYSGDGGPATQAQINNPYGLVIGPDDALYFCDIDNHVIRRVDLKSGKITTAAGSGRKGYDGDGKSASQVEMNQPYEVRFDHAGNMYWVEMPNHVVRKWDPKTDRVTTIAGTGAEGYSGDGGKATEAQMSRPHSIQFDPQGRLLICDIGNHRVRRVDLKTGIIDTYLGTGGKEPTPDGAPIAGTPVNGPRSIDIDPKGNLYLVLREGNAVYKIDPGKNTYEHIAGQGGKPGYAGDGGPAKQATLGGPKGIAYAPSGDLYIADTESHTIRKINLKTGKIETVLGTGKKGNGVGSDPLKTDLARPHGIFVDKKGTVYVGDSEAHRVRVVK